MRVVVFNPGATEKRDCGVFYASRRVSIFSFLLIAAQRSSGELRPFSFLLLMSEGQTDEAVREGLD